MTKYMTAGFVPKATGTHLSKMCQNLAGPESVTLLTTSNHSNMVCLPIDIDNLDEDTAPIPVFEAQGLQERLSVLSKSLFRLDKMERAKEIAYERASKHIRQSARDLVQAIRSQEDRLLGELWAQHTHDIKHIQIKRDEKMAAINQYQAEVEASQKNARDPDKLLGDVAEKIAKLEAELPILVENFRSIVRFAPLSTPSELPRLGLLQACMLSDDYNTVTKCRVYSIRSASTPAGILRNKHLYGSAPNLSQEDRKSDSTENLSITFNQPQLLYTIDQSQSIKSGEVSGLVFLPNGNSLVADKRHNCLQEFDNCGKWKSKTSRHHLQPDGIALTREQYIAITDGIDKNIKVFTRGGDLLCKFGTGYFHGPGPIAATSRDHYVLIDSNSTKSWDRKVYHYNPMTGEKAVVGNDDNSKNMLSHPEDVAVGHHDKIFISDSNNHHVYVFSSQNRFIGTIGQQGQEDGDLAYPKGVFVDSLDRVLVADCGNHRISMFTSKGKFMKHVLTKEHGLHFPRFIQLGHGGQLAVMQDGKIMVFKIHI